MARSSASVCVPAAIFPASSAWASVLIFVIDSPIHAPLCAMARMEQSLALGRPDHGRDHDGSRRFTGDGHPPRIAAEGRDILLHPSERRLQVHHSVIARGVMRRLSRQFRMREKAEHAQPVVVGHHHRALPRQLLSVVARLGAGPSREPSAVGPHDHGQAIGRRFRRGPDVEVQAILAGRRSGGPARRRRSRLRLGVIRIPLGSAAPALPAAAAAAASACRSRRASR